MILATVFFWSCIAFVFTFLFYVVLAKIAQAFPGDRHEPNRELISGIVIICVYLAVGSIVAAKEHNNPRYSSAPDERDLTMVALGWPVVAFMDIYRVADQCFKAKHLAEAEK